MPYNMPMRHILLAALLFTLPVAAQAEIKVLVVGDTLTAGYQLQPSEAICPQMQAIGRAAGYPTLTVECMSFYQETTRDVTRRAGDILAKKADIVVIALGSNDALKNTDIATDFHPALDHLTGVLARAKQRTLVAAVPAPAGWTNMKIDQWNKAYYSVSKRYTQKMMPNLLTGVRGNKSLLLSDGYHPNAQGMRVIAGNVLRQIDDVLRWKVKVQRYESELHKTKN